ncbi:protein mono-ADP-ribosyltransferase TIPARP-like [Branchiostoma lanceolatum]|uniref:protein mono-ADP-ribosyltransferase TIPARP-like n=1 Tax=Branchiostoma lanceolatum TaxID=7740 RepID=UPI0034546E89
MYQQNLDPRYSTKRLVRRRPVFVQFQTARATNTRQSSSGTKGSLPKTWKPLPQKEAFIRVPLAPTHSEFKEVETLFRQTMRENMIILQIERVQNPRLWEKYDMNKQQMTRKSIGNQRGWGAGTRTHKHNDERKLFHGTEPDIIRGICHQNFDFRLSGNNATAYGKGSYFAKKASYSHAYSRASPDGRRFMFLANVLVGSYTTGKSGIPRPPPIDQNDPNGDLYDSCVDNEANPKIFVVFKDDQCYPAYLITYQDSSTGYHFSNSPNKSQGTSSLATNPMSLKGQPNHHRSQAHFLNNLLLLLIQPMVLKGQPNLRPQAHLLNNLLLLLI